MIDRMTYVYKFPSGNRTGVLQKEIPDVDWNPSRPAMYTFFESGCPPLKMSESDVTKMYGGLLGSDLLKLLGLT